MSRRQLRSAREVVEEFMADGSDIESTDSELEDFNNHDEDSDSEPPFVPLRPAVRQNKRGGPSTSAAVSDSSDSNDDDGRLDGVTTPARGRKRKRPQAAPAQTAVAEADWTEDLSNFPRIPAFTGTPGLKIPDETPKTPLGFIQLIFSNDLLRIMKEQTNLYAAQELPRKPLSPHSTFRKWKAVKLSELWGYLTILVHMALVKKPKLNDYWSTSEVLKTDFAGKIMSRDRFKQVLALFHLNDNRTHVPLNEPNHDPLHKLRPFIDYIGEKFQSLYVPERKIAIDEAICPWRGHLRFRVYMKDKPSKWGIKLYELCESATGYVYRFEVYCAAPGVSNRPTDVCVRMMGDLLNKGYILYTDNYYTCPALADSLLAENTMLVGTVRANRVGMPRDLPLEQMQTGDIKYRRKGDLAALRWLDKKPVHILTTIHDPTQKQRIVTRTGQKDKPVAVQDYTCNMAGVDLSDQLISYFPLRRRTMKWWKKLFFHLFTLALIQCHILYNKYRASVNESSIQLSDFLKLACAEMAQEFFRRTQRDRDEAAPNTPLQATTGMDRLVSRCLPKLLPPSVTNKKQFRKCHVCTARKIRKETSIWCETHNVPLCGAPCFGIFHSVKDYKL